MKSGHVYRNVDTSIHTNCVNSYNPFYNWRKVELKLLNHHKLTSINFVFSILKIRSDETSFNLPSSLVFSTHDSDVFTSDITPHLYPCFALFSVNYCDVTSGSFCRVVKCIQCLDGLGKFIRPITKRTIWCFHEISITPQCEMPKNNFV